MSVVLDLPRWDMTSIFPSLDSAEFDAAFESLSKQIDKLESTFDAVGVNRASDARFSAQLVEDFEKVVERCNDVRENSRTIGAYIHAFVTTDSRDMLAQAKHSQFQLQQVRLSKLNVRLTAWFGSLPIDELLEASQVARDMEFVLRKALVAAKKQMSPSEESLAADMSVTGALAWSKLYGNLTSQIVVRLRLNGEDLEMPMSVVRNLAYDPDRNVRCVAYNAELEAWEDNQLTVTACLNGVKGEVRMLCERRGWTSPLDAALFDANIDRETLDAMLDAARDAFPSFRRYLKAKARALGFERLAWYDIFAPVGRELKRWDYNEAANFIASNFETYSTKLRDFALRAFAENWIDAEPRPAKRDGAFCMGVRGDESRILMNFRPAFGSVSTLAHELGHGYHNLCLSNRASLQRSTPMTLAETASIFCETIIRRAALRRASDAEERRSILEAALQGACQTVVDISSRFLFERAVFERRADRELSAEEFCELMTAAQKETYGDGLDPAQLHPYMWAAKPHYYGASLSFYNFPYMFGLLFGLGLYAKYEDDPVGFKQRYDDLLSMTGLADPATLAKSFDLNIREPDFWRTSLDVIEKDIEEFVTLNP